MNRFLTLTRFAARDLRGGFQGLRIFLACIALGVWAIVAVNSLARALEDGLARDGRVILGGDAAFSLIHRELNGEEKTFLASHGELATVAGAHMIIADGRVMHPLRRIGEGGPCTWFLSPSTPLAARKIWIGGTLELKGAITIDAGAARALASGKSLLPAGVTRVEGAFARGDCVVIRDEAGAEIGRGLIAYDALHAERIRGRNSRDIAEILGTPGRAEMIHRDDMALAGT